MTNSESQSPQRERIVIIGIGNALRRDDGVGPLVLDACRYEPVPGCDLVELDGDVNRVIEAWSDRALAVVVDAVCTGDAVGTLHDLSLDRLDDLGAVETATGSRLVGLAEALAVGQQLNQLPDSLRVLGIEPGDLKPGFGLSPAVAASMDELVERARSAVTTLTNDRI